MRLSATFLLLVGLCSGEVTYKRDSVARKRAGDHPSLRPTRGRCFQRTGSSNPLLGLAPDGVYQASHVAVAAGALLPHRFSLACNVQPRKGGPSIGGLSLLHVRQVAPTWLSPASSPVESRLSSTASLESAPPRSPGHLTTAHVMLPLRTQ